MTKQYTCDNCEKVVESGYTVAWTSGMEESVAGIHFGKNHMKQLCGDCWPRQEGIIGKLKRLFGVGDNDE